MPAPIAPAPLPGDINPADLLRGVLDVSLTALQLLRPVYASDGAAIVDFTPEYTNPAGLRMLGFAQQPGGTMLSLFPHTLANGILAYYQRAFAASEVLAYELNYQADGLDNYFRVQAQQQGALLLVSFTDTSDQPRSAVEVALRASQAAEQVARAEAERQRQRLYEVLMQLPAHVAVHNGPEQEYILVNPAYQRLAAGRDLLGQTARAAWPELTNQGIIDTLDRVYQTGEPFVGTEVPLHIDFARNSQPTLAYYNFYYLPLRDVDGRVSGVLDYSYDVTEQVLARQHVEQLNRAAQAARAEAEAERQRFEEVLMQLPAQVAVNRGPDHVFSLVNGPYQQMFSTRPIQGRPVREALPELAGQVFFDLLDRVYQTGEPFYSRAMPAEVDFTNTGRMERRYVDVFFQALHDAQGRVDGILNFSYDVTEQVLARQQVEQLNQELEARVQQRTQELSEQQALLGSILGQVPAAVATFSGPEHHFSFFNAQYQRLLHDRAVYGVPVAEAIPETAEQGFITLLDQVYQTGQPFVATEQLVDLRQPDGTAAGQYFNFVYQPLRDRDNQVTGILSFTVEVTKQVQARQQNEALQAELLATAQRQAAEREGFYHVLEQAPVGVTLLRGRELRFEYVNPTFQRIFPDRPLLGLTVATAFPEGESQGFIALHQHVYDTGIPYFGSEVPFVEAPVESQPPRTTYFDFSYQAMREGGQTVGICAFAFDVTDKVLARQMREMQHRELTTLFEQAPAGVCILDGPELVYTFANPAYQAILPGRELLGRSVLDVIPELRGSAVETLLRQVYATGETYRAREQCIPVARPDGELENRYFSLVYQARRDHDQRITGILNLVVEVTEQLLARQQADAAAAELRLLTAHSPAFLFRLDAAGHVVYLNKEFFEWTGLDATRLQSLDEGWLVVLPGDLAVQHPIFEAAVRAGQPWLSAPYRFRRHDGQYRWMLSRSQPLFGAGGEVTGYSGLTVEIHEQAELQQQLERTNVDLDNFIYTASHDLKAPITNIEGLLLALEHELPHAARTGDVPLMLTMMQDAVDRFRRTITHLTDLSRLQKEHNPASNAVALAPVVEDVRLDITPLLLQTQGQLTVSIPDNLTVTFAEKNLRSVVYNLLSNAFKYRHPDRVPEVQLRSWLTDGYVVLEVQDNGLGLDLMQGQERLFAMFQRLHTHVEGTGVGLYMVKRILENAGGRIEVDSELGEGTTFRVFFRR